MPASTVSSRAEAALNGSESTGKSPAHRKTTLPRQEKMCGRLHEKQEFLHETALDFFRRARTGLTGPDRRKTVMAPIAAGGV